MPITLNTSKIGKLIREEEVRVNEAKILELDINVERKITSFIIGYGFTDKDKKEFIVVEKKVITVVSENFNQLANLIVEKEDVGKRMYDLIGEKSYKFLMEHNLLK